MWNNEKGLDAAQKQCTNGTAAVQNYGEQLWEALSYVGSDQETFKKADLIKWVTKECHLAKRTADLYVAAFFAYCLACPEEFSGPRSRLVRVRHGLYRLDDGVPLD